MPVLIPMVPVGPKYISILRRICLMSLSRGGLQLNQTRQRHAITPHNVELYTWACNGHKDAKSGECHAHACSRRLRQHQLVPNE
jgi:hypothetical protein